MDLTKMWEPVKRYVAGAIMGVIATVLAGWGITEVTSPETYAAFLGAINGLLTGIFYVVTILGKTWLQNRALGKGEVLAERVESKASGTWNATEAAFKPGFPNQTPLPPPDTPLG